MPAHPAFDRRVSSPVHPQHRVLVTQLLLYGVPERVRSFHRFLPMPSHVLALLFGSFPAPISISTAEVPSMATVRSGGTIPTRSRPCLPMRLNRPSHSSTDCGKRRWIFHRLCSTHPAHRGKRLKRPYRRSYSNWLSLLGTSHPSSRRTSRSP